MNTAASIELIKELERAILQYEWKRTGWKKVEAARKALLAAIMDETPTKEELKELGDM